MPGLGSALRAAGWRAGGLASRVGRASRQLAAAPQVQIALALGASIIALAWVSKRVLDEPMRPLALGLTSFVVLVYEMVSVRYAERRWTRSRYWVAAVLLTTVVVILLHVV